MKKRKRYKRRFKRPSPSMPDYFEFSCPDCLGRAMEDMERKGLACWVEHDNQIHCDPGDKERVYNHLKKHCGIFDDGTYGDFSKGGV